MAEPHDWVSNELLWWEYKNMRVAYRPSLDGHGSMMAHDFVSFLRDSGKMGPYRRGFEWCAGPAFIAFAFLAEGICETLCLADINPAAVECLKMTVAENHLEDRVSIYLSNNLRDVPKHERFDFVVGAPPNFYNLNPVHPATKWVMKMGATLRPLDERWELHREFYRTIGVHLEDGAPLFIYEADPFAKWMFMPAARENESGPWIYPEPYDIRPRPPIEDFRAMMREGGLRYVGVKTVPFSRYLPGHPGYPFWVVLSKKDAAYAPPDWTRQPAAICANGRVISPLVAPGAQETSHIYLTLEDIPQKQLKLVPDDAWLRDLLAAISTAPLDANALAQRLGRDLEDVYNALDTLYDAGWVEPAV